MNRQKPFCSSSELMARRNAQMIYANKLIREEAFLDGRNKNLYSLPSNRDYSNYITTEVGGFQTDYDISNEDKLIVVANAGTIELPGAPTNVTAVFGNSKVTVSWSASSFIEFPITSYIVTSNPGGFTATSTGTSAIVTGLTNGTAYTFTVVAINDIGQSPASAASGAVTPATTPASPTVTGVTSSGSGQVSISFTAGTTGGSAITGYVVTPYIGAVAQTPITSSTLTSPIIVSGLTNGTAYTVTLAATNLAGTGTASTASGTVTPVGVPLAPTGVTVTKIASGQIQVSFTQLSGISAATGGTAITGYTITPSPDPATTPLSYSFMGSAYTFTNLTPSTSYTFGVFATNFQGNSATTTSSSITA